MILAQFEPIVANPESGGRFFVPDPAHFGTVDATPPHP